MRIGHSNRWADPSVGTGIHYRSTALIVAGLMALLAPGSASGQAPSPEQALTVVAEYVSDQTWIVGDWYLGVDLARIAPGTVISAPAHREILGRIAQARDLPFYAGEDFGRVVCEASPDPEQPATNCRFPHGTRSMLTLVVTSSDSEEGVTRVRVLSGVLTEAAARTAGEVRTGFNSRSLEVEVRYGPDGSPQADPGDAVIFLRSGFAPVDQIVGAPPAS